MGKPTTYKYQVSISTEQDLFINWDFGPKHRSEYRNKKEVAK